MPTTFRSYRPEQMLLLPPDFRDWVPEGHLAHHVSDLVGSLDLSAFYAPYEGDGRRNIPYEPSMMVVKMLIYGYATGVFSSRKIAKKLEKRLQAEQVDAIEEVELDIPLELSHRQDRLATIAKAETGQQTGVDAGIAVSARPCPIARKSHRGVGRYGLSQLE